MKKVETQNLASHKGVVQFSEVITCMINGAILASHKEAVQISGVFICMINGVILARETPGMNIWRAITSNIN